MLVDSIAVQRIGNTPAVKQTEKVKQTFGTYSIYPENHYEGFLTIQNQLLLRNHLKQPVRSQILNHCAQLQYPQYTSCHRLPRK